ncbi:MFS general substrate transporter [Polychaeton citri CBS 116435]|uniref:MFS general substrate transporter n=1 Tax=Polychaeton citri CBS 116435 TaxID=1314669 RepID=A0A9P4Q2H8_9PEZI|nr:MFS general substrate transporter [Polychaeton citri CBS 116435]
MSGVAAQLNNATSPTSQFRSRPDLHPPIVNFEILRPELVSPGYIFIAPYRNVDPGPYIYDNFGNLIWSGAGESGPKTAHTPRVCQYKGQDHLCYFTGEQHQGFARGHGVIMDRNYRIVKTIDSSGAGASSDMHEFKMTPFSNGTTVLMTVYQPRQYDLTVDDRFNLYKGIGWIVEGVFQEVDIETGKVIFEWRSLDHVDPSLSWTLPGTTDTSGDGLHEQSPWDYFHINSVDKNVMGDYLISARHVSAIYKLSGKDGSIMWQMGGNKPTFAQTNFKFSYQHHARWVSENETHTVLSFYDNGSNTYNSTGEFSHGWIVLIDHVANTATMVKEWGAPEKSGGILSGSQGNMQLLPNGGCHIGWGEHAYFSEHAADGTTVMYAKLAQRPSNVMVYRSNKYNWTAQPLTKPALWTYSKEGNGQMGFWVSWNGATEVHSWNFYLSDSPNGPFELVGNALKHGFETEFLTDRVGRWAFAQALNVDGHVLEDSVIARTFIPGPNLIEYCHDRGCDYNEKVPEDERVDYEAEDLTPEGYLSSNRGYNTSHYYMDGVANSSQTIINPITSTDWKNNPNNVPSTNQTGGPTHPAVVFVLGLIGGFLCTLLFVWLWNSGTLETISEKASKTSRDGFRSKFLGKYQRLGEKELDGLDSDGSTPRQRNNGKGRHRKWPAAIDCGSSFSLCTFSRGQRSTAWCSVVCGLRGCCVYVCAVCVDCLSRKLWRSVRPAVPGCLGTGTAAADNLKRAMASHSRKNTSTHTRQISETLRQRHGSDSMPRRSIAERRGNLKEIDTDSSPNQYSADDENPLFSATSIYSPATVENGHANVAIKSLSPSDPRSKPRQFNLPSGASTPAFDTTRHGNPVATYPPPAPTWSNMPNKGQLAILACSRFVDFFQMAAIQTYMVHQLKSFDASLPESTISHQAGMLQGAFTAAQIFTSILWGRAADRPTVGRKLVLNIGLVGTGIGCIGVGFSRTFGQAVFWRVMSGAINGTVGSARTMVAECTPKPWHPRAFLLLPAAFNVANVLGPILGGLLVDPVRSFPSLFGENSTFGGAEGVAWLAKYPYAIANLLSTIILFAEAILVHFFLEETLKGKRPFRFQPVEFIKSLINSGSQLRNESFRALQDIQRQGLMANQERSSLEMDRLNPQGDATEVKPVQRLPFRRIWTSNVLWVLVSIAVFDFHMGAFSNLWILFLATPREFVPDAEQPFSPDIQQPPPPDPLGDNAGRLVRRAVERSAFKFKAGLNFPPPTIGFAMAIIGFIGVALQFLLYPWANGKYGLMRCFRASLFLFPLAYYLAPYIALLPSSTPPPGPSSGATIWLGISFVLFLQVAARTFALPASIILLNNSSPHPSVLATIHGLGQACSATFRTLGPMLAGYWYGIWLERGVVGMAWWITGTLAATGCVASFWVRNGSGHEIFLPGEEQEMKEAETGGGSGDSR